MTLDEYRQGFLLEARARAESDAGFIDQAFVELACEKLTRACELANFVPCHARLSGPRGKSLLLSGYEFDEDDDSLKLVIGLHSGDEAAPTLTRSEAERQFKGVLAFAEAALEGWIEQTYDLAIEFCRFAHDLRLQCGRGDIARFRVYLVTDRVLSDRVRDWPQGDLRGIPVEYRIWDCNRLFQAESSLLGQEPVVVDFAELPGGGVPLVQTGVRDETYEGWLGVMPGEVLAEVYDRYGARLLEGNVRAFLSSRGKVNKGIRETILKRPSLFFAFNNGIAATASAIETCRDANGVVRLTSATNFQIVNGGQTTASLATTRRKDKADLSRVAVAVKLSVVRTEDSESITPDISRFANSQNKVSDADLASNHPFHTRIEQLSREQLAPPRGSSQTPTRWFYERSRGQYDADLARCRTTAQRRAFEHANPKEQLITKELLARVENAWSGFPHLVSMGGQKNFMRFAARACEDWQADPSRFHAMYFRQVVGKLLLLRAAESIASDEHTRGIKAHVANYVLARVALWCAQKQVSPDWDFIWKQQTVSPEWREQLSQTAAEVLPVMTATESVTTIITEWFKKDALWERVKQRTEGLRLNLDVQHIALGGQRALEAEARMNQVVLSELDDVSAAVAVGQNGWIALSRWEAQNRFLSPTDRRLVTDFSDNGSWVPSPYQAKVLMKALRLARERGCPH